MYVCSHYLGIRHRSWGRTAVTVQNGYVSHSSGCNPHTKISGTWQTWAPLVGCSECKYTTAPYLRTGGGPAGGASAEAPRRVMPLGLTSISVYSMVGAAATMWYCAATNLRMLLSVFWRVQVVRRLSAGQARWSGCLLARVSGGLRAHLVRGLCVLRQDVQRRMVFFATELLDGDADAWPAGCLGKAPLGA